jgi:TolB-like protein/Flp pilus assembly protein TadD
VVITDFGIARAVQHEAQSEGSGLLGTPEYMAPEQVEAAPDIDARADVYALGVTLFEMLTGALPFVGTNPMMTAAMRLLRPPPDPRQHRPGLPAKAAEIILRCMARDRAERYPSALAVSCELAALLPRRGTGQSPLKPLTSDGLGAPGVRSREKTVAVLPFRNQSSSEEAHLAEGLTEELIDALSMAQGVKVRSRGAVMALLGDSRDGRALGDALGVQLVVEGALRRAGDQLRVTVRLLHIADGFQVWAQRFDRKVADFFSIADEAAQALIAALTAHRDEEPERPRLTDAQAVELYLRARKLYHSADLQSLSQSSELLEQALAVRPGDPKLLSGYALTLARRWFFGGDSGERAHAAAERAMAAAPNTGESQLAMAVVRFQGGELPTAVRHLQQALRRSPTLADAHELLGRILIETGPLAEGQRSLLIALDMDPSMLRLKSELARTYALQGHLDQADQLLGQLCENPATEGVAWILRSRLCMWGRDVARATALLKDPRIASDRYARTRFLFGLVVNGQRINPEQIMAGSPMASGGSRRTRSLYHQLATEWYGMNSEVDALLRELAKAIDFGLVDLMWLDGCPLLAAARKDPRFLALRRVVAERAAAVQAALQPT